MTPLPNTSLRNLWENYKETFKQEVFASPQEEEKDDLGCMSHPMCESYLQDIKHIITGDHDGIVGKGLTNRVFHLGGILLTATFLSVLSPLCNGYRYSIDIISYIDHSKKNPFKLSLGILILVITIIKQIITIPILLTIYYLAIFPGRIIYSGLPHINFFKKKEFK